MDLGQQRKRFQVEGVGPGNIVEGLSVQAWVDQIRCHEHHRRKVIPAIELISRFDLENSEEAEQKGENLEKSVHIVSRRV